MTDKDKEGEESFCKRTPLPLRFCIRKNEFTYTSENP